MNSHLVVFENKKIRRIKHSGDWYFSIIDVIGVLTETQRPRKYWSDLKSKLLSEGFEMSEKIGQLKLRAEDGKLRETDCANTETLFRIIQSIPSPRAEPFKLWLSKVGYERVKEIENPELTQERMKELYKQKGYSDEWIEKRVRGIAIRQELTDEWKKRGSAQNIDFAILTNEISTATFGKNVEEYKKFKGLQNQNLRDHMDDTELILTMLGENVTTRITRERDSNNFLQLKKDAKDGGKVAAVTRKNIEAQIRKPVVSKINFLIEKESTKRKQLPKK